LDHRLEEVQSLRESGLPTVPFRLEEELLTNPFLRVEDAAIQQAVGMQGQSEVDVFRALRALKDGFSA
jgi:hydroxyacylglutathione hydrolase